MSLFLLKIILFASVIITIKPINFTSPVKFSNYLWTCINRIIDNCMIENRFVAKPLSILVDDVIVHEFILPMVTEHIKWPVFVLNMSNYEYKKQQFAAKPSHYIIVVQDFEDFQNKVIYIKGNNTIWENDIRILVIALTVQNPKLFAFQATNLLKLEDINGIIITQSVYNKNDYNCYMFKNLNGNYDDCYRFFPNHQVNYCRKGNLTYNENVTIFKNEDKHLYNVIAINRKPNIINLKNGTLSGPITKSNGVEHNTLNLIAEILNISFIYLLPENEHCSGDAYPNGTIVGALLELHKKTADIAVGSYTWTYDRSLRFYPVFPFIENKFVWFFPHILEDSRTLSVNPVIFILIITTFLLLVLLHHISNILESRKKTFGSNLFLMLSALISVPKISKLSPVRRSILNIISFLNLFLNVIIFTTLASILTGMTQMEIYGTLEKLFTSTLNFKLDPIEKQVFMDYPFGSRIVDCKRIDVCLTSIVSDKNSTVGMTLILSELFQNELAVDGKQTVGCLEYPIKLPLVMYMRHGFPYYKKIKYLILEVAEKGFMNKFIRDLKPIKSISSFKYNQKVLQFKHLKLVFIIYGLVSFLNTIIFVCEYVFNRYNYLEN